MNREELAAAEVEAALVGATVTVFDAVTDAVTVAGLVGVTVTVLGGTAVTVVGGSNCTVTPEIWTGRYCAESAQISPKVTVEFGWTLN